jgi:tetratricopeptide (TPR) repeat protein
MKLTGRCCVFLIALLASTAQAQNLRDSRFVSRAEMGFDCIFNMDYDKADQAFSALGKEYAQHPAPPLYLASILWLKEMERRQDLSLNRFIAPTYFNDKTTHVMPPQERLIFFAKLQESEVLCKAILQKNRGDKDGRYFLATIYGLRASFAITVDHNLREAFSYGNKCYALAKQLTTEDPKYYDAYMALGVYEYCVGAIPWYMRWMIYVIGGHGSKETGLFHLSLSEKGQYVKDQTLLVSMILNVRENHLPQALKIARDLTSRFPRSYLFPINLAQILSLSGRKEESIPLLQQVEKRAETGDPNFDRLPLASFRFNAGLQYLYAGKLDLAKDRFTKSASDPQSTQREKTLAHLNLARILDWQRNPAEAIKECQIVLSLPDVDDSRAQARKLLNKLPH